LLRHLSQTLRCHLGYCRHRPPTLKNQVTESTQKPTLTKWQTTFWIIHRMASKMASIVDWTGKSKIKIFKALSSDRTWHCAVSSWTNFYSTEINTWIHKCEFLSEIHYIQFKSLTKWIPSINHFCHKYRFLFLKCEDN
jgi:hypothetical protein